MNPRARVLFAAVFASLLLLVAACGGDDDTSSDSDAEEDLSDVIGEGTDESSGESPETSDESADESSDEAAAVCDLLTDEEIAAAVGFDVVDKEADTMALPMCEWELDATGAQTANIPVFSIVLLPENDYASRVDPLRDRLITVDGAGDEALLSFADIPNAMAGIQFFAIDGSQGIHILPGLHQWEDQAAAEADLAELASLAFGRL